MGKLFITPLARGDLLEIRRYLAEQSPTAAEIVGRAFERAFERLVDSPSLGHARTDLAPEPYRFYLVHSYYVVYRIRDDTLRVVRVLHSSRDVGAEFGR